MTAFKTNYRIYMASPGGNFIVNPRGSVQTWQQVSTVISDVSYQVEGKDIRFLVDWGTAAEYIKKNASRTLGNIIAKGFKLVFVSEDTGLPEFELNSSNVNLVGMDNELSEYELDLSELEQPQLPLEFACEIQSSQKLTEYYIEYFLFKVYLALNLSSPGCCNFYETSIFVGDDKVIKQFGLSTDLFGDAYKLSTEQGWPAMPTISLLDSWNWLQKVNPDFKRVAQTNIEKVLFALLHACRDRGNLPDPDKLIWLAHALEALFETPEVGISKTLRDRIFLVLGSPATNSREIRKLINSFYKFRSAFVHGRLDIAAPTEPYDFDDEAGQLTHEIMKNMAFATSLIVATLQLLIQKKWRNLEFGETFSGQSL